MSELYRKKNLIYYRGSIFSAPKGSILAHSCNCEGVWGSGIARTFKLRNPNIFNKYQEYCKDKDLLGYSPIFESPLDLDIVCCLMVSQGGSHSTIDSRYSILKHTDMAIKNLKWILSCEKYKDKEIHMPMINSGVFRVPWEITEEVLNMYPDMTFHVWGLS